MLLQQNNSLLLFASLKTYMKMKKIKTYCLVLLCSVCIISCSSSDDENPTPQPPTGGSGSEIPNTPITDDLLLIAIGIQGNLYQIGNNTGAITNIGKINPATNNNTFPLTTLVTTDDTIFALEYNTSTIGVNNLLVYDRQTNTTEIVPLTIPNSIPGDARAIQGLLKDGESLIGILTEDFYLNQQTKHLIRIDLQDYSITELGITFTEDFYSSMVKINSMLYISTWDQGLLEIDLNTNTVNNINTINGSRMVQISDTELAIMQKLPNEQSLARPALINLTDQTITPNTISDAYGLVVRFGPTILVNQLYMNFVVTINDDDSFDYAILKTNFDTGENSVVVIEGSPGDVNSNLVIIDTVPTTN